MVSKTPEPNLRGREVKPPTQEKEKIMVRE
jgi:hypothetical protein